MMSPASCACALLILHGAVAANVLDRRVSCNATSYYDCGAQVGRQAASWIQRNIAGNNASLSAINTWAQTPEGQTRLQLYITAHQETFPHLLEEIRGISAGSGVAYETLLLLNLESELMNELSRGGRSARPRGPTGVGKGCSDYHLMSSSDALWGHNEDGFAAPYYRDTTYLVHAHINVPGERPLSYVAFTYPGRLSGWAWGYNSHGLVASINALTVPPAPRDSGSAMGFLGVNFVARHVLAATSIEDAVTRASMPGHAGGQHFNLGSVGPGGGRQMSVETSPWGTSVLDLDSDVRGGLYAHFNQYLHSDRPRLGDYESSVHRLARAAQYSTWASPPSSGDDVLRFLSDTEDESYPVYRSNTEADPEITLTTTLFDLHRQEASVYVRARPCPGSENSTRNADVRAADAVFALVL